MQSNIMEMQFKVIECREEWNMIKKLIHLIIKLQWQVNKNKWAFKSLLKKKHLKIAMLIGDISIAFFVGTGKLHSIQSKIFFPNLLQINSINIILLFYLIFYWKEFFSFCVSKLLLS